MWEDRCTLGSSIFPFASLTQLPIINVPDIKTPSHCFLQQPTDNPSNFSLHTKAKMTSCLDAVRTRTAVSATAANSNSQLRSLKQGLLATKPCLAKTRGERMRKKNIRRFLDGKHIMAHYLISKQVFWCLKTSWRVIVFDMVCLFVEGNEWCTPTTYKARHATTAFYLKKAVKMYLFTNIIGKQNIYGHKGRVTDLGCYRGKKKM